MECDAERENISHTALRLRGNTLGDRLSMIIQFQRWTDAKE